MHVDIMRVRVVLNSILYGIHFIQLYFNKIFMINMIDKQEYIILQ